MPFVSGLECDVFISYAKADNQSVAKDNPGWVTSLRDVLKSQLDQGLQRSGASEIWMDYELRGNEPFAEQLQEKVSRTATLVVVLSEAYLASTWCRRELETFLKAAIRDRWGATGRIFLVHYEPISPERWPSELRGLTAEKYRFFQQERDGATSKPLGFPIPNPHHAGHEPFYDRVLDLRRDLAAKLKDMALRGSALAQGDLVAANTASAGPAVFLAEVTGDTLYDQRQLVKSHLEQSGLRVLPTKFYSRTPAAFAREMDRDLAECVLFAQMLGRFGSPRTPDLPDGYEGLQYERARAASTPILRWRNRDLPLDCVPDSDHRNLLNGRDVQAMDIEELKRTLVERFRVLAAPRPASMIEGERFVLVTAAAADLRVADAVAEQLAAWNVGYDVVDDTVSLRDLAELNAYDALMVIYGNCPHDWVRQQLSKCREILLAKKTRAPACAVYIGPPEQKEPLRYRPPRVAVIDPRDQNRLRAFIEKLPAQDVSR